MGDYVPTTREIESGAVQVTEVVAVKDNSSVPTTELEAVDDEEASLQFAVTNIATKNWEDRFDVMRILRKLLKFCPECIAEHIAAVGTCLVDSIKNPRSSIMCEALMLTADLFTCRPLIGSMADQINWTKLVPVLLQKGINDKKFVAAQGLSALDAFTETTPECYAVFIPECDNRNAKLASMAMRIVDSCASKLGPRLGSVHVGPESAPLQPLITCAVKAMLKGKLADMRKYGQSCVQRVIETCGGWEKFEATYGQSVSPADMKSLAREFGPKCDDPEADRPETAPTKGKAGPPRMSFQERRKLAAAKKNQAEDQVCVAPMSEAPPMCEDPSTETAVGDPSTETAVGRLRKNSTTPRSRKSDEAVVMEF